MVGMRFRADYDLAVRLEQIIQKINSRLEKLEKRIEILEREGKE